ncbi:hypothetical protein AMTR_s00002p00271000 [Amborella trichopoda]|uniref:Uncharacterized protein n=1 Tax=Amborella trichopoda TaxID=13333 RepID=W1P0R2_AMBTC|nr:hypothetical protein AMTR_s00002p00271000 [Amborella trichopoda]
MQNLPVLCRHEEPSDLLCEPADLLRRILRFSVDTKNRVTYYAESSGSLSFSVDTKNWATYYAKSSNSLSTRRTERLTMQIGPHSQSCSYYARRTGRLTMRTEPLTMQNPLVLCRPEEPGDTTMQTGHLLCKILRFSADEKNRATYYAESFDSLSTRRTGPLTMQNPPVLCRLEEPSDTYYAESSGSLSTRRIR